MSDKRGFNPAKKIGADFDSLVEALESLQQSDMQILERLDLIDKHNVQRDEDIKKMFNAFPASDWEGHRRYHEAQIEILMEKRRLRSAIQEKTISGLIWLAIVAIGLAVWHEIVNAVHSARN